MIPRTLAVVAALLPSSCGLNTVTHQLRPNTTMYTGVWIAPAAVATMFDAFTKALPKETALCLYGETRDSLGAYYLRLLRAEPARIAHADSVTIYFQLDSHELTGGCRKDTQLLGAVHNHHALADGGWCAHSEPDALYLYHHPKLLFSMVICRNRKLEVLWQDGRRQWGDW